jgi:cyclopropane fatty-acyl-phospholipid synthase-like methyltransferase
MYINSFIIHNINIKILLSIIFAPIVTFIFYIINWFSGHIGLSFINHKELVCNCYNIADIFIGQEHTSTGLDFGYNFYDGNKSLSPLEAQQKKYEFMWNKLNLEPGHNLLDIGCGYGDWIKYCMNKGVNCIGINISKSQCISATKRGIKIINKDWELVNSSDLVIKFDAITSIDAIEHYVSPFDKFNIKISNKKYEKLFSFIKSNLKDNGLFLTSCLFLQTPYSKWNIYLWISAFIIDYSMSGYYPQLNSDKFGNDQLTLAAKKNNMKLLSQLDTTENYRITQIWNNECWQNCKNLNKKSTLKLILNLIIAYFNSPSFFMSLIGYFDIGWTTFWGENALSVNYDENYRQNVSHIRCFIATYKN